MPLDSGVGLEEFGSGELTLEVSSIKTGSGLVAFAFCSCLFRIGLIELNKT